MSTIFKALLALPILAAAVLTIPSEASAKGHGHPQAGNQGMHKPHNHDHRKPPHWGGGGGGFDDDDDDDDDSDCKMVLTERGWIIVCDLDDDDDDD